MFGYVAASMDELTPEQKQRWGSVYCGICRRIGKEAGLISRGVLRYDCAFLALLLMSLYEPEEIAGQSRCLAHPLNKKPWVDNEYIRYAACMNVALGYYKAIDDAADEGKLTAKALIKALKPHISAIEDRYPRQCHAIRDCLSQLAQLEAEACQNIDRCAASFGALLGAVFVYREDLWAPTLEKMGFALGRFIYLADAHCDLEKDRKQGAFNPYLTSGFGPDVRQEHLTMAMAQCSDLFERLPLVQDKPILDNIIYSGVWLRIAQDREAKKHQKPKRLQEENHA